MREITNNLHRRSVSFISVNDTNRCVHFVLHGLFKKKTQNDRKSSANSSPAMSRSSELLRIGVQSSHRQVRPVSTSYATFDWAFHKTTTSIVSIFLFWLIIIKTCILFYFIFFIILYIHITNTNPSILLYNYDKKANALELFYFKQILLLMIIKM